MGSKCVFLLIVGLLLVPLANADAADCPKSGQFLSRRIPIEGDRSLLVCTGEQFRNFEVENGIYSDVTLYEDARGQKPKFLIYISKGEFIKIDKTEGKPLRVVRVLAPQSRLNPGTGWAPFTEWDITCSRDGCEMGQTRKCVLPESLASNFVPTKERNEHQDEDRTANEAVEQALRLHCPGVKPAENICGDWEEPAFVFESSPERKLAVCGYKEDKQPGGPGVLVSEFRIIELDHAKRSKELASFGALAKAKIYPDANHHLTIEMIEEFPGAGEFPFTRQPILCAQANCGLGKITCIIPPETGRKLHHLSGSADGDAGEAIEHGNAVYKEALRFGCPGVK